MQVLITIKKRSPPPSPLEKNKGQTGRELLQKSSVKETNKHFYLSLSGPWLSFLQINESDKDWGRGGGVECIIGRVCKRAEKMDEDSGRRRLVIIAPPERSAHITRIL